MLSKKGEYPVHMLGYMSNLAADTVIAYSIFSDEYVFATYFSAIMQGMMKNNLTNHQAIEHVIRKHLPLFSPEIETIEVDLVKQENMMKIVDNLRSQFNEQVSTTYVRDFFFSIAVYRELNHDRDVTEAVLTFGKIVKDIFQESMIEYTGVSSITTNIRRVSRLLGLSTAESRLIELNLLLSIDIRSIIFRDFLFSVIKNPSMFEFIYRTMLNTPEGTAYDYFGETYPSEIDAALTPTSTPIAVGMVSYDRKTKKISTMTEFWVFALSRYVD
jgi:hypothetical protein